MGEDGREPTEAGLIMGDSVDVMIQELSERPYAKVIKIDNQAAVNLLAEPAGGWRTRHLRLRAANLRWRLSRTDWMTEAIPGADQVADIGTKVMTAPRLEELKKMMGMGRLKKKEEVKSRGDEADEEKKSNEDTGKKRDEEEKKIAMAKAKDLIQLAVIVGCMGQVKAQEEEDREGRTELFQVMALFALAVIGLASVIERITPCLIGLWNQQKEEEEEKNSQKRKPHQGEKRSQKKKKKKRRGIQVFRFRMEMRRETEP